MARILVVDGSGRDRTDVEATLLAAGHDVVTAVSGRDALPHISSEFFDAVIVDVELPDMSGVDFVTELRTRPSCRSMPVLILTQEDDVHTLMRAQAAGASSTLSKPFAVPELIWAIEPFALA